MEIDEVDGEVPCLSSSVVTLPQIETKDVEKSQTDSGVDDGSHTGSMEVGENSDDEDDIIVRKPKTSFHRILDDDSDVSQDVPTQTSASSNKTEMTAEEVLDAVMAESPVQSDDDSVSQPSPRSNKKKKKLVKRPVSDDSSDDEVEKVSLMDTIRNNMKNTGTDDLFDTEEHSAGAADDGKTQKKAAAENLFDSGSDSDSPGCKSSGSEVEASDKDSADEDGIDTSTIDPKLLAKLKKGAAKKENSRSRRSKQDEKVSLHSETQRMVRESRVNIPYHQPAPKSINDFLARANKKQQEYRVLKGARDSMKVKIVQQVLEKTRIQAQKKTQEELDKFSDSDEDWDPEDKTHKSLKERIDERLKGKDVVAADEGIADVAENGIEARTTAVGGDIAESRVAGRTSIDADSRVLRVIGGTDLLQEESEQQSGDMDTDGGASSNSNSQTPSASENSQTIKDTSSNNHSAINTENTDTENKHDNQDNKTNSGNNDNSVKINDEVDSDSDNYELFIETSSKKTQPADNQEADSLENVPHTDKDSEGAKTVEHQHSTEEIMEVRETSASKGDTDDVLFDWEREDNDSSKTDSQRMKNNEQNQKVTRNDKEIKINTDDCFDDSDEENKENIDPNDSHNQSSHNLSASIAADVKASEKPSTSCEGSSMKSSPGTNDSVGNAAGNTSTKKRTTHTKLAAALADIDLDTVRPCLSGGNTDCYISLEEGTEVPRHPGVQNLMDRLTKHATKKPEKKKKDIDISIISKDTVGIDKEELTLNTFTYHVEDEEVNPLLKLETPGAKLVALKEQLQEKMKARREQARQKRQEMYDMDNEEGGFQGLEAEEGEMSDRSDTDEEEEGGDMEEDFEEIYGQENDEEENEKEENPFADNEAAEEDDFVSDGDADDNCDDAEGDDVESDDDLDLKLELSDDEQSDGEADESEKPAVADTFKEPNEREIPEKPFSMFGSKGREHSLGDLQSGQKASSHIPMPIEDSQDLCGTMATQNHTQKGKPSQDFSFFMEDSQSNMLDADGYLKSKSTGKKRPPVTSFPSSVPGTQSNMDELFDLCSGRFAGSQAGSKDKSSRKTLFDDSSASNTQTDMEQLKGFCSGVFVDKSDVSHGSGKQGQKRKTPTEDSDADSIAVYSDTEDNQLQLSDGGDALDSDDGEAVDDAADNEEDGDTDQLDSDEEEEQAENNQKFTGFTANSKRGKILQEFVDEEAELSGSEYDSDENLDLAEEDDIMEMEEGDKDVANMDKEKLRDEVGRVHFKQLIDEDKRELLRFQEMYLPDGDLHSEGGGRARRFRWSNMDDDTQQDMFNDDGSDIEADTHEQTDDNQWRKDRYEREKFLKEQEEKEKAENADNSQFLKFGKVFLKKRGSTDSTGGSDKGTAATSGSETPGFPGSFMKLSQQKRGSFLARSKEALAKIAEMTKPVVNPSAGAKSSGKFTFSVVSPGKEGEANEAASKGKQRKAHVPSASQPNVHKPPAKKAKLDSQGSFSRSSIFNHL